MSIIDYKLMSKGDEIFVLTLFTGDGVQTLAFSDEDKASEYFKFIVDQKGSLGVSKAFLTNSFFDVDLQEEYLMGEVH